MTPPRRYALALSLLLSMPGAAGLAAGESEWDIRADTWVATDALGREVPTFDQAGAPRPHRFVVLFYFLWHGEHVQGGPYDISQILAADPDAMQKPDSPLWGPLHAPHHWGESIFGYYRSDDAGVLRKHAQMLSDAGVDAIVFDVSNQVTYQPYYTELLRVFDQVRRDGGAPPRVAFLCPFWDASRVVAELYRDLYAPGLFSDLWFRWKGKPLILADPEAVGEYAGSAAHNTATRLLPGQTLGQTFTVAEPLTQVGGRFATWQTPDAAMTLAVHRRGPGGGLVMQRRFSHVADNSWVLLKPSPALPAGTYYLEMSEAEGTVGWWSHTDDIWPGGKAYAHRRDATGDRTLRLITTGSLGQGAREFFTFRKPQPDYFAGPTQPDMWSWLEVFPQHVFSNSLGEPEQMSVGVAQNAVGTRLATLSEPGARGRSFHGGERDPSPDAVLQGLNFAEQWRRALAEDPQILFITGWNEWIAGRFNEFAGVKLPVLFVDQFNQENSRDIEPMKGGHGDNYYYQMVANIRRYKGVRPLPVIAHHPISVDGVFDDWARLEPEFRDTIGDPVRRDHPGWEDGVRYLNRTGNNDLVAAKACWDDHGLSFQVRAREPLRFPEDSHGMALYLNLDLDAATGWLGYDHRLRFSGPEVRTVPLEKQADGGFSWVDGQRVACAIGSQALEVAIPYHALGLTEPPSAIEFKWADNIQETGRWSDFTLQGDAAPNDRFNYRARLAPRTRTTRLAH